MAHAHHEDHLLSHEGREGGAAREVDREVGGVAASGTDWLASKPAAACGDEGARPICRLPPVESVGDGLKDDGRGIGSGSRAG